MHYLTYNPKFTAQEELLIDKALQEMPEKEIIKETVLEEVEFVYSIFITLKSDGGACLTLHLKKLNKFVKYEQFEVDGRKPILNMI